MNTQLIEQIHRAEKGKIKISSAVPINNATDLANVYTPGVAHICKLIAEDRRKAKEYTVAGKVIAIISDGSAVLGLGNIGDVASLPVLEGKAAIFGQFAGVEAFPICIESQDSETIISTIKNIAGGFAAINLEDISAPRCFEIERRLSEELNIPVMHDDQHGTAIVALAGLKGALKLTQKKDINIVILGAGAAGNAIAKLLSHQQSIEELGINDIKVFDSKGLVNSSRGDMSEDKIELAGIINQHNEVSLADALKEADVFIGVSGPNLLSKEMVQSMRAKPIIFGLANPDPEILPADAHEAGASIVATGRSDFPNQVNNALAYPGVFKGLLKYGIKKVNPELKLAAADAIYNYHLESLTSNNILPSVLDTNVPDIISDAIGRIKQ